MSLNILQLSIVHRLPQSYRWRTGFTGSRVEPIASNDNSYENQLIGLKLLGYDGEKIAIIMEKLSQALSDIDVASSVVECEGSFAYLSVSMMNWRPPVVLKTVVSLSLSL